jgi:hypothetical protein
LWPQTQRPYRMVLDIWERGFHTSGSRRFGVPEPAVAGLGPPEAWPPGAGLPTIKRGG